MEVVQVKPKLLPPAEGKCRICAVDHPPEYPHNAQSLFYQTRFQLRYDRPGTWADAAAHCTEQMQAHWRAEMEKLGGVWTMPPDDVATIAEPIDG
jgi:hypothetical protein